MSETHTTTFTVEGMTCDHCVAAVTEELSELTQVQAVRVDLATGAVEVDASAPVAVAELDGAVDEAGYRLVADSVEARPA